MVGCPSRREALKLLGGAMVLGVDSTAPVRATATGDSSGNDATGYERIAYSWPMAHHDPRNTGHAGEAVPSLTFPLESAWKYETSSRITEPVVANDTLVVTETSSELVVALDPLTGEQRWQFHAENLSVTVAVGDELVFAGTSSGDCYAVDIESGEQRWHQDGLGPLAAGLTVSDGTVYTTSRTAELHALDAETGTITWSFQSDGIASHPPLVKDDVVYLFDSTNQAYAVSESGKRWKTDLVKPGGGNPVISRGRMMIPIERGEIIAVDVNTGSTDWTFDLSGNLRTGPAVSHDVVYVSNDIGTVYAVSITDGLEAWRNTFGGEYEVPPIIVGGSVAFGSSIGDVVLVNLATGIEQWRRASTYNDVAGLAGGQGGIFVAYRDGLVRSYQNPDALAARKKIRSYDSSVATAVEQGTATREVKTILQDAVDAFTAKEYEQAISKIESGQETISELVGLKSTAERLIDRLSNAIESLSDSPASVTEIRRQRNRAQSAYENGDYQQAKDHAESGLELVEELRANRKQARDRIDTLKSRIEKAESDGIVVDDANRLFDAAKTAFENGEYETANSKAKAGIEQVSETRTAYRTARRRIDGLEQKISKLRSDGIVPRESTELLETARSQYEAGAYRDVIETAERGERQVDERRTQWAETKRAIERLSEKRDTISERGLATPTVNETLADARSAFENGEYERASELVATGTEQLSTTKEKAKRARAEIEKADAIDQDQQGLFALGDAIDDDSLRAKAKTAYDDGQYDRAIEFATRAQRNERLAIYAVDAGIGGIVLSGLVYKYRRGTFDVAKRLGRKFN